MSNTWRDRLPADAVAAGDKLADRAAELRNAGHVIYPTQENIFRALQLTPPNAVRVVILGQDPYHQPGQAIGLSFATPDINPETKAAMAPPPSLVNIQEELCRETGQKQENLRLSNDLTPWAKQGVLLLNASLTVERSKPASHSDWGWDALTGAVLLETLKLPQPVIYLLWGSHANNVMENALARTPGKPEYILTNKYLLKTTHPSPFSARRSSRTATAFIGSDCFDTTNKLLIHHNQEPIDWLGSITKHDA